MTHNPSPTSTQTDALVSAARQGESWAWFRLVEAYQGMVYAMVLRSGIQEPAEDVLQEVFLKIFKALDRFRGDSSFKTWVFQITLNTIHTHGRKASSERALNDSALSTGHDDQEESEGFLDRLPDPALPDPPLELHQERMRLKLREAFALLQPKEREILVLRELQELSYGEIAIVLHLEIGTVKSRISRARSSLHLLLCQLGVTP